MTPLDDPHGLLSQGHPALPGAPPPIIAPAGTGIDLTSFLEKQVYQAEGEVEPLIADLEALSAYHDRFSVWRAAIGRMKIPQARVRHGDTSRYCFGPQRLDAAILLLRGLLLQPGGRVRLLVSAGHARVRMLHESEQKTRAGEIVSRALQDDWLYLEARLADGTALRWSEAQRTDTTSESSSTLGYGRLEKRVREQKKRWIESAVSLAWDAARTGAPDVARVRARLDATQIYALKSLEAAPGRLDALVARTDITSPAVLAAGMSEVLGLLYVSAVAPQPVSQPPRGSADPPHLTSEQIYAEAAALVPEPQKPARSSGRSVAPAVIVGLVGLALVGGALTVAGFGLEQRQIYGEPDARIEAERSAVRARLQVAGADAIARAPDEGRLRQLDGIAEDREVQLRRGTYRLAAGAGAALVALVVTVALLVLLLRKPPRES